MNRITKRNPTDVAINWGIGLTLFITVATISVVSPAVYVLGALVVAFVAIMAGTAMAVGKMFGGNILDYLVWESVVRAGFEALGWILWAICKTLAASAGSSD